MTIPGSESASVSTSKHAGNRVLASWGMRRLNKSLAMRMRAVLRSGSEGGALVETAVALPVLMLLMTGIFSFSIAVYQKLELAEAVSNGGRTIAVDYGATNPCLDTANKIYAAAPSLSPSNMTVSISFNGGAANGASCSGTANTMTEGGTATVMASYPCTLAVYGYTFPGCTIASTVTEVVQ